MERRGVAFGVSISRLDFRFAPSCVGSRGLTSASLRLASRRSGKTQKEARLNDCSYIAKRGYMQAYTSLYYITNAT